MVHPTSPHRLAPEPESRWDHIFRTRGPTQVSWYQAKPAPSLALINELDLTGGDPLIDVGGGASPLVDELLHRGHRDVTVLDVSAEALQQACDRLGARAHYAHWVQADLLAWTPPRQYRLWHDRAVLHFLTDPDDRARYRTLATTTVAPGGYLIVGTFAADGPSHCSGLPVARYTADQLATALTPGFTPLTTRRETHHTPSGAEQPFTWQVLHRTMAA